MACLFLADHIDEHTVLLGRDFNKHQEIILRPQLHVKIFILSSLLHIYMAAFILTPTSRAVTSEQILCVALYVVENRCSIFFYISDGELMSIHISQTLYRRRHHQHHPQQSNYYYMIYISSQLWCTS